MIKFEDTRKFCYVYIFICLQGRYSQTNGLVDALMLNAVFTHQAGLTPWPWRLVKLKCTALHYTDQQYYVYAPATFAPLAMTTFTGKWHQQHDSTKIQLLNNQHRMYACIDEARCHSNCCTAIMLKINSVSGLRQAATVYLQNGAIN